LGSLGRGIGPDSSYVDRGRGGNGGAGSKQTSLGDELSRSAVQGTLLTKRPGVSRKSGDSFRLSSDLIRHPTGGSLEDPFAKCFLVCCGCRRYHDLPAEVYESLLNGSTASGGTVMEVGARGINDNDNGMKVMKGRRGSLGGAVKCQWCQHAMTIKCCENWAICVKLVERLS